MHGERTELYGQQHLVTKAVSNTVHQILFKSTYSWKRYHMLHKVTIQNTLFIYPANVYLLDGLEVCPLNVSDLRSLDYSCYQQTFYEAFQDKYVTDAVTVCQAYFDFDYPAYYD